VAGRLSSASVAGTDTRAEHPLGLHRVESTTTPRVASQQAPGREHHAPQYAVLIDCPHRVARAGWLIPAAARKGRRYKAPIDQYREGRQNPRRAPEGSPTGPNGPHDPASSPAGEPERRPARSINSSSDAPIPPRPSRSANSRASGRATTTTSCPPLNSSATPAKASRRSRFTRFRSTAPPTLRETDRPRRGLSAAGLGKL
jgi:hypothetical protein